MELLPLFALIVAGLVVAAAARNRARGRRLLTRPIEPPDGRTITASPVAAPLGVWLRLEVSSELTRRELRERKRHDDVAAARRRLLQAAALALVDADRGCARLVVRPRATSAAGVDLAGRRAVELVQALERSRATTDAEGSPAGTPVAVRATGGR